VLRIRQYIQACLQDFLVSLPSCKKYKYINTHTYMFNFFYFFWIVGCTSAPHIALLILTTWLVIWNPVSTFIRLDGKLDCLPY
jgi:hypothetical protein